VQTCSPGARSPHLRAALRDFFRELAPVNKVHPDQHERGFSLRFFQERISV